jgi:hypothetical protein
MRQPTLLGAVAAAKPRRAGGRVFGNCGPANPAPVPANFDDQVNSIDALFVLGPYRGIQFTGCRELFPYRY